MPILYTVEHDLSVDEFVDVLRRSGLAERRPVDEPDRIRAMVENANLTVSARSEDGLLVGVARSMTDFAFCCYVSDLAVDAAYQGRGIGRELLNRSHEAAGGRANVTLLLLAAPGAVSYYPRVGLAKLENCYGAVRGGA